MIENKINNKISNIENFNCKEKIIDNNKLFGFWVYIMSDCIIFAVLFSFYAIIFSNTLIDSEIKNKIFNLFPIFLETFCLLLSSLSCAFVVISMYQKNIIMAYWYLIMTFFLGFCFLFMEIHEFYELVNNHFGPNKHAFFSIFFALIGMHGIHIFFGLIFILSIFYQIKKLGFTKPTCTRILCFSIFWHFLDIIWIFIFTFVYLNGAI